MNPDYPKTVTIRRGADRLGAILSKDPVLTISIPVELDEWAGLPEAAVIELVAQRFADEAERRMASMFEAMSA
jgi:hypothetical protein